MTPLGEKIVYDLGAKAKIEACKESVGRVRLLTALFAKLGPEYHSSDFIPVLQEVTGAKPNEIEEKAARVERLYKDAIQYLRLPGISAARPDASRTNSDRADEKRVGGDLTGDQDTAAPPPLRGDPSDYHIYQTGENYVRLRRDADILEVAKGVIQVWLDQTKKPPKPSP